MEHQGWRIMQNAWICPFCTGNTANLYRTFESEGEDHQCDTGSQS